MEAIISRNMIVATDEGVTKQFKASTKPQTVSPGEYRRLKRAGAIKADAEPAKAETKAEEPEEAATPDLDKMTVAELRDYAATKSIDLGDATKKADIIGAIKAATA